MRQRESAIQRFENGRLGSKALARKIQGQLGHPCTFPADPNAFALTFDETPTQDPGDEHDEWVDSDEDDHTLPPTPPRRKG